LERLERDGTAAYQNNAQRELVPRQTHPSLLFERRLELKRSNGRVSEQVLAEEARPGAARRALRFLLRHQHARAGVRRQPAALEQDVAKQDEIAAPAALPLLPERLIQLIDR